MESEKLYQTLQFFYLMKNESVTFARYYSYFIFQMDLVPYNNLTPPLGYVQS